MGYRRSRVSVCAGLLFVITCAAGNLSAQLPRKQPLPRKQSPAGPLDRSRTSPVTTATKGLEIEHKADIRELCCRGGANLRWENRGPKEQSAETVIMLLTFGWSPRPADASARGLDPGTCSWADGSQTQNDPTAVQFETPGNAEPKQKLRRSADRSPTAVNYPDAQSIPAYLTDTNHYWRFFVSKDPVDGRYIASYHSHWNPSVRDLTRVARRPGMPTQRDSSAGEQQGIIVVGGKPAKTFSAESTARSSGRQPGIRSKPGDRRGIPMVGGGTLPPPAGSTPLEAAKMSARPNPVPIPAGQTSGRTTLTWDGGAGHPFAEVWVQVDNRDETFVVEQGTGKREMTIDSGKTYVFKLSDAGVLLASITVTGVPESLKQPPKPGKTSGALTTPKQPVTEVSQPFFRQLHIEPRAGIAHVSYATIEPASALIEVSTASPLAAIGGIDVPVLTPAGQKLAPAFPPGARLASIAIFNDKLGQRRVRINRLEPNTRYNYVITAGVSDGRKYRYWGTFQTLNRTVKVVFERVNTTSVRHGNLQFAFAVNGDWVRDAEGWVIQYPGSGLATLRSQQWAEVNVEASVDQAPGSLPLAVLGADHRPSSFRIIPFGSTTVRGTGRTQDDPRPEGRDSGSDDLSQWSTATDHIDASANDSDQPGVYLFKLRTNLQGGNLAFEATGRIEVSYSEAPVGLPKSPVRPSVNRKVSDAIKGGGTTLIRK